MTQLRFSLRSLFITTAIVALGCFWLVLPSINARDFVAAVKAEDYKDADSCFRKHDDRFLVDWNETYWRFHVRANIEPWSLRDFMRGKRLVSLLIAYGDAGPVRSHTFVVPATPAGMLSPQIPQNILGGSVGPGGIDVPLTPQVPAA